MSDHLEYLEMQLVLKNDELDKLKEEISDLEFEIDKLKRVEGDGE